jgi:hypothetical protein
VQLDVFNAQTQPRFTWSASYSVARAYIDQLARGSVVPAGDLAHMTETLDRVERTRNASQRNRLLVELAGSARAHLQRAQAAGDTDAHRLDLLARTLTELREAE